MIRAATAGTYQESDRYYRPIPEWIADFGYLAAPRPNQPRRGVRPTKEKL